MNKTINVNIGGRIFSIEEDAFSTLEKYLKTIRASFDGHQSADEIIADIELRISELFAERITDNKQVIVLEDVDAVIGIMGKPEDYIDSEDEEMEQEFKRKSTGKKYEKRVFRDPDDKLLFGVCSGLSAYLGWDPIILRALFVISTVAFGFGPLVYIILALIIPKAKTTAEKLQMRGEAVTVDNISKKVNESFTDIKDDLKDFGKRNDISGDRVNNVGKHIGDVISDFFEALGKILKVLIVVLAKIIGVVFFLAGSFALMALITGLLGMDTFLSATGSREMTEFVNSTLTDSTNKGLVFGGIALTLGVPAVSLLLLGIRMLFQKIRYSGIVAIVLIVVWFVGIGLLAASGVHLFENRQSKARFTETLKMNVDSSIDTLVLDIEGANLPRFSFSGDFMDGSIFFEGGVTFPWIDSTNVLYVGKNSITTKQAAGDRFLLEVEKSARGSSQKDAIRNARQMKSSWSLTNDSLRVSPYFVLEKGNRVRSQKARYTLYVPEGKAIRLAPSSKSVIYDIPNISNTRDLDMLGETWLMTKKGLKCTTCFGAEKVVEAEEVKDEVEEENDQE
ncbi:MAG: phage shock protein PspC (stress-responsive transcriptional regulator) [Cryomorphaceae bacterium]|jgi:phage shock protein PspC (stress-responsive transcriptional regulator)